MFLGLIILHIIMCTVSCNIQEPQCTSLYDYEHKLLYKLIKIEEDVKSFKTFIEEFKLENAKRELQQRQLFEASIAKLESAAKEQAEAHTAALAKMDLDAKALAETHAETHTAAVAKLESVAKMQAETHVNALSQLKSDAKMQADAQAEAHADALAQLKSDAKSQADAQAKTHAEALAQLKSDANVQAEAHGAALAKLKSDAKVQADAQAEAQAEALAQLKSDDNIQAEEHADALTQLKADANVQAEAHGAVLAKLESAATVQAEAHVAALAKMESAAKDTLDDIKGDSSQLYKDHEAAILNMTLAMKRLNNAKPIGFSVKAPTSTTTSGQISFSTAVSNDGAVFDLDAGEFVCKTPGVYFFTLSILKNFGYSSYARCSIYKNSDAQVYALTQPTGSAKQGYYEATNSVFLSLDKDDKVTLRECTVIESFHRWSSFSGFLVKANTG